MYSQEEKSFVDIIGNEIINIDFKKRNLRGRSFEDLLIWNVDFSEAQLQGVSFKGSKLINVKINNAQTGITTKAKLLLEFLGYTLAFLSGMTTAYSVDYFFLLIQKGWEVSHVLNTALSSGFLLSLFVSIRWGIVYGIGPRFSGFLLANVVASFFIQALAPSDVAATSILSLSCFFGGLFGFFTQSQVIYLFTELKTASTDRFINLKIYLLDVLASIGVITGALIGARSVGESRGLFVILIFFSICIVVVAGRSLGFKAKNEKNRLSKEAEKDFFELDYSSLPSESMNFRERAIEERRRRLSTEKRYENLYSPVRILFETVLNNCKTSFWKAVLKNVSFKGADFRKIHFSPQTILIRETDENISEAEGIERKNREKILDPENNDFEDNSLVRFKVEHDMLAATAAATNNHVFIGTYIDNSSTSNLDRPSFGGGFAGKDGIQTGGELRYNENQVRVSNPISFVLSLFNKRKD